MAAPPLRMSCQHQPRAVAKRWALRTKRGGGSLHTSNRAKGGTALPFSSTCSRVPAPGRFQAASKLSATGPGGGVLDKPDTALPKFDLDKDVRTRKKKPPRYQVMLHNDEVNRREYVVKVLLKIVPTLTMDDAVNIMNEAHVNGMAAVIVCAQEEAEDYCEGLRNNGLVATIEPCGPSD